MAIRSTAPSTPSTCSAPLPLIATDWLRVAAVGMARSPGRATLASSTIREPAPSALVATSGAAPSEASAASVGALEPIDSTATGWSG